MKRSEVYFLIDAERLYQDRTYDPYISVLSSGQTRQERDIDPSAGLNLLDVYVRKAQDALVSGGNDNLAALQQIGKIAAIAVRILESAGGSEVLLTTGLR